MLTEDDVPDLGISTLADHRHALGKYNNLRVILESVNQSAFKSADKLRIKLGKKFDLAFKDTSTLLHLTKKPKIMAKLFVQGEKTIKMAQGTIMNSGFSNIRLKLPSKLVVFTLLMHCV